MPRLSFVRSWLAYGALAGCTVVANTTGCGGGSASTATGPDTDGGGASSSGASGGGEDSGGSSSGVSSSGASSSGTSSSGGASSSGASSSGGTSSSGSSSSGASSGGEDGGEAGAVDAGSDATSSGGTDGGAEASSGGGEGGSDAGASSGGGEAGAEGGANDGGSEAAPACSPSGSACALGATNGLCLSGVCSACSGPSGTNAACSAAYGDTGTSGYVCVAGSCTAGNCNTSTDCTGSDMGELCTGNVCTGCTTDAQCQGDSHYGASTICNTTTHACVSSSCGTVGAACMANAADVCCGATPACIPGNCCANADCGSAGGTPACNPTNNTCQACDALGSSTFVVVDPLDGSDAANSTGSGTVGGQTNGICAFKTIGHALTHLGSATTVKVLTTGPVSPAGNGETFPIAVTENGVTITGSGGTATVDVTTAAATAFNLDATGVALTNFLIDGDSAPSGGNAGNPTADHGVVVLGGATTASIGDVEIRNFTEAGIRVQGGTLTVGAGTYSHNNGIGGAVGLSGLHVTSTTGANATRGVAVIDAGGGAAIQFNANGQNGVLVDGQGSVTITGTGAGGSVVTKGNTLDGIEIHQSGATPPLNTVTGLLSKSNTGDGGRFYANSNVQVRSSVFVGNANGVNVVSNNVAAAGDAANNDVSNLDLGTNTGSSPGLNVLQDATTSNTGAGLCLSLKQGEAEILAAEGNTWVSSTSGADVDCSMTAGTLNEGALGLNGRACAGGVDVGGTGLGGVTTPNGVSVNMCTCGGQTTCP